MLGRGVGRSGGAAGLADLEEGWRRVARKPLPDVEFES